MEILGILLLVPLSGITIIALFAALTLLFPAPIEKTRNHFENAPGRSFLLGLINFIFFGLVIGLCFWAMGQLTPIANGLIAGIFTVIGSLIAMALFTLMLIGLVAISTLLGERMGGGKTPFISILRGGTLLLLAGLAPYVGWFIFTPIALWTGLGAAISALIRKQEKTSSVEDPT